MKDNDQQQINEAYERLNEGPFAGGGGFSAQGTPEQSDGPDTSDRVTEDDIKDRLGEISSQMRTLDRWIDHARTTDLLDEDGIHIYNLEEVWDDLNGLQQNINGFVTKYAVEEEDIEDTHDMSDDEVYDDPRGETSEDKWGGTDTGPGSFQSIK
jgi:hypothetical protein